MTALVQPEQPGQVCQCGHPKSAALHRNNPFGAGHDFRPAVSPTSAAGSPTPTTETCTTQGCGGDPRYAAPGRGHTSGCTHPFPSPVATPVPDETQQDDEPHALEPPLDGLSGDDVLADLHAKWHCEPGNLMGPDDCGWEGCEVYAILQAVVPALASRPTADTETLRAEKREQLRRWYHSEVCEYLPDGGINCDDLAEAAVAALDAR